MAPVVIAKDLYKCYAGFTPVLRGVNLEVLPGEMVAIMGPSGCGKSTMLHILGLLHAPDSGSLEILDTNVLKLNREQTAAFRRGNIGFVMQSSNLFEHSTVFENVEFPLIYENVPPQERWERVIRALDLVRLSARVHYRSNRLSGGEQQRVAIARAMVNNPRILMADEPTGALDARTSKLIMENFRALCHSGGVSMIMVTHDPKMAEYCDSIYTLEEGVLVCRKHEDPDIVESGASGFLNPPPPLVRGALVAWKFPQPGNYRILELASRLNSLHLLSRIYSLSQSGFLGNPEGYSLPLAVRRMGFWEGLKAFFIMFRRARSSESLWSVWRRLPPHSSFGRGLFERLRAFSDGAMLARWGLQDNIQFFYGSSGGKEATAAWVAARLLRLPFAFALAKTDFADFGPDCALKACDSAFVVCSTKAEISELRRLAPELPEEKILLARNGLPAPPGDEEADVAMPGQQILPTHILAVGESASHKSLAILLKACARLKKREFNFRLSIIGKRGWRLRWLVFLLGLRRKTTFLHNPPADRLGEIFRTADIFAGAPARPDDPSMPDLMAMAMAYGLGIIARGAGKGMLEALRDNENCLIIKPGETGALYEALEKLGSDMPLRKKLGEAAKRDMAALLEAESGERLLTDRVVAASALAERRMAAKTGTIEAPRV